MLVEREKEGWGVRAPGGAMEMDRRSYCVRLLEQRWCSIMCRLFAEVPSVYPPLVGRLVWHLLSDLYCEIYASWTVSVYLLFVLLPDCFLCNGHSCLLRILPLPLLRISYQTFNRTVLYFILYHVLYLHYSVTSPFLGFKAVNILTTAFLPNSTPCTWFRV